jgi:hypothetical protein
VDTKPAGKVVGVLMASGAILIDTENVWLAVLALESVTVAVNDATPATDAFPETTPAAERVRPAGNPPAVSAQE